MALDADMEITADFSKDLEESMKTLTEWLQNSTTKTVMVRTLNSTHKRLVYQEARKRYKDLTQIQQLPQP
jgi:hypothetical protein